MAEEKKERKEKKSNNLNTGGLDLILVALIIMILFGSFSNGWGGVGNFFTRLTTLLNPFSNSAPLSSFYSEKDKTPIGKTIFNKENNKTGKIADEIGRAHV